MKKPYHDRNANEILKGNPSICKQRSQNRNAKPTIHRTKCLKYLDTVQVVEVVYRRGQKSEIRDQLYT